jgi:hypothetical protein
LVAVGLALGVWGLWARPSAVASEGGGEPTPHEEKPPEVITLKTLAFKSDFTPWGGSFAAYLWDKTDAWAMPTDPPNHPYGEPEWTPDHSYPVVQKRGTKLVVALTFDVTSSEPGAIGYHLVGSGEGACWTFTKDGTWPGPGSALAINGVTAAQALPDTVGILKDKSIHWTIIANGQSYDLGNTGPHKVYRTFDTPQDGHETVARLEGTPSSAGAGCCTWAEGQNTAEAVVDAIWNSLGDFGWQGGTDHDPPFEPGEKSQTITGPSYWARCWELMDGDVDGECDEQAALMNFCCRDVGLAANTRLVHASTNGGAGHCLNMETRYVGQHGNERLILAASPGPSNWQQFEGCCEVPVVHHYYAVWPAIKATDDYDMLKNKLAGTWGWKQYWVYYNPNVGFVVDGGIVPVP